MKPTIVAIGDLHFPFSHDTNVAKVIKHISQIKPDYVVQMGDLYDMYAHSRFARNHDIMTPQEEAVEGRRKAAAFWACVKKASPNAGCYQIIGNHDDRPIKALGNKYPEIISLLDIRHLWKFPGVKTMESSRDELVLQDIVFIHGYKGTLGQHTTHNLMSTVVGHSHVGGVRYIKHWKKTLWELNVGFLADPEAAAMNYTAQRNFSKWTQGFGIIDSMGPRFVCLD